MSRLSKITVTLAGVLLAATALSAPAMATDKVSGNVVRIGVMNDQTGPLSSFSGPGSVIAARLAVQDFGGKVLGAPIEVIAADHQNKPDIAVARAREWFDIGGVDLITDLGNSAISLAIQDIGRSGGKMIIHAGSGADRLYGEDCSETGFIWTYDTYTFSQAIGQALSAGKDSKWFYIAADYAYAKAMEARMTPVIEQNGGKVVGAVRHPVGTTDFASFILQAQASGAQNIALLNTGDDTATTIKQAAEFGLADTGQSLVGSVIYLQTVKALGLPVAQGLKFITAFYWDRNDETRAFAERFFKEAGGMPSQVHAGVYSSTLAYLRAVEAAGTDDGKTVGAKLRELPVNDFFGEGAHVRPDGRLMNNVYLVEVKKPEESKRDWDFYKVLSTLKAEDVVRPLDAGNCPLVKKG